MRGDPVRPVRLVCAIWRRWQSVVAITINKFTFPFQYNYTLHDRSIVCSHNNKSAYIILEHIAGWFFPFYSVRLFGHSRLTISRRKHKNTDILIVLEYVLLCLLSYVSVRSFMKSVLVVNTVSVCVGHPHIAISQHRYERSINCIRFTQLFVVFVFAVIVCCCSLEMHNFVYARAGPQPLIIVYDFDFCVFLFCFLPKWFAQAPNAIKSARLLVIGIIKILFIRTVRTVPEHKRRPTMESYIIGFLLSLDGPSSSLSSSYCTLVTYRTHEWMVRGLRECKKKIFKCDQAQFTRRVHRIAVAAATPRISYFSEVVLMNLFRTYIAFVDVVQILFAFYFANRNISSIINPFSLIFIFRINELLFATRLTASQKILSKCFNKWTK